MSFGPAMVRGDIDEEQVAGYDVFFASDCSEVLGPAVATVDRHLEVAKGGCCEVMHYVAPRWWCPIGRV